MLLIHDTVVNYIKYTCARGNYELLYWEKDCRIKFSSATMLHIIAVIVSPSERDEYETNMIETYGYRDGKYMTVKICFDIL